MLCCVLGASAIGQHLSQSDSKFNSLFNDAIWRDVFEKSENAHAHRMENQEISTRVHEYLHYADTVVHMPVSEIMLIYHKEHRSQEEESSQVFIPFINVSHSLTAVQKLSQIDHGY